MKNKIKKITYIGIIITICAVVVLIVTMITNINKIYSEYREQAVVMKSIGDDMGENIAVVENYEEVSSDFGKTVEQSKEEEKVENTVEKVEKEDNEMNKVDQKKEEKEVQAKEVVPDPSFIKPVEGKILKEYSKENLVYSETLKEWTTHNGIDIEADLTTVVKATAEGIIKSIKDDPRYGLTVIIEHANGFETRYSNLLTAEFVVVGEKVSQGQTIGTVGNTASFEILDKPHIHFEILKNSEYLEPTSYIK